MHDYCNGTFFATTGTAYSFKINLPIPDKQIGIILTALDYLCEKGRSDLRDSVIRYLLHQD